MNINAPRIGKTAQQIIAAPFGAVFVCRDSRHKKYLEVLKAKLGRNDLEVRPIS
jgi:hypothetical protein